MTMASSGSPRSDRLLRAVLAAGLAALLAAGPAEAAGPWHGRVVDAETGEPLQGVVVLAYWIRYEATLAGWAGATYAGSEEVVTSADGRFTIGSHRSYTIPAVLKVSGPEWVIFKPSYGRWELRGTKDRFDAGDETVIELPPLKTREERLKFHVSLDPLVPQAKRPNLDAALNEERRFLFGRQP